jgi:phenylpropionate dioxygenase-like ring-hydroxylating dioxygenase large terminal subunit
VVFVNLSESPRPLADFLGRDFYQKLEERTSSDWSLALRWQPKFDVNWKIPVENSLEAYHVPAVHPHTFREDPGSDRSEHRLLSNRTWFSTQLPFSPHSRLDSTFQSFEGRFVRWLGYEPTARYEQHHVFPNLLFSFTDAITLINCIHPTGPRSCSAVVRQFGRLPARPSRLKRLMAQGWSRLTAAITKKVLMEDVAIFSAIQAGVSSSPHAGVLGRCEERIHSFQAYLQCTIDGTCHD